MKRRIYAFTLIELLVVISIIALLVAILLPALGKARTQAKFTLCSSQEHQVGIGEHLYAADNSSRFTPGNAWNSGTVYVGKNYGHVGAVNHGQLMQGKYIPIPTDPGAIFYCPGNKEDMYSTKKPLSDTSQRSLQNRWGLANAIIESTYWFRDSADGGVPPTDTGKYMQNVLTGKFRGARSERIAKNVIYGDIISANYHQKKFNFLRGDGSVQALNDTANRRTTFVENPKTMGLFNWFQGTVLVKFGHEDYIFFDAVDYMFNTAYYLPPYVEGDYYPAPRGPWRR
jgi:prepilin-type N-terminal cleavage/methylation domain-containing protein